MMKQKNNLHTKLKRDREESLSWSGSLKVDWTILIISTVLLLTVLLFSSWRFFTAVNSGTYLDTQQTETQKESLDSEQVNRIVEQFKDRRETFMTLTNSTDLFGLLKNEETIQVQIETSTTTEATSTESFDLSQ